jgi:hypothetical protein
LVEYNVESRMWIRDPSVLDVYWQNRLTPVKTSQLDGGPFVFHTAARVSTRPPVVVQ